MSLFQLEIFFKKYFGFLIIKKMKLSHLISIINIYFFN
jgi:hypothetical protein